MEIQNTVRNEGIYPNVVLYLHLSYTGSKDTLRFTYQLLQAATKNGPYFPIFSCAGIGFQDWKTSLSRADSWQRVVNLPATTVTMARWLLSCVARGNGTYSLRLKIRCKGKNSEIENLKTLRLLTTKFHHRFSYVHGTGVVDTSTGQLVENPLSHEQIDWINDDKGNSKYRKMDTTSPI